MEKSIQEEYGPGVICFGCGPSNPKGLRIRSFPAGEGLVAQWTPEDHHQAFPGVINGGIIGALLDCHSNWTAAWHIMQRDGESKPPVTVTGDFHVRLRRPTPMKELTIRSSIAESEEDRIVVDASIEVDGTTTATCRGTFVRVREGHPAWHRW
ncbi:MAG: PaaI family thioesterase [Acidobacteria bacterium]|nr:PaaI family thioesterase [Acidobacteriota bacterium]